MQKVKMFDYVEQYESLHDEIRTAIERVLRSGQLILGPEGKAFEEEFAEFLGGGGACVGVNSGTDALAIALRALEIGPGDEVVTVANTAVPTVSAIRMAGATPVFCDVDPRTCLMDQEDLTRRLTDRTRAVIPVHLFGNVVDVPRLREAFGRRPIRVVEDCAQAHGARLHGQMAGTMGDIGAFSFYPTKNLGAYGDGGLCWTGDPALAKKMRMIRMYGFDGRYYSEIEGVNSRLDELQAAILRVKLRHLPEWIERRQALARRYDGELRASAQPVEAGNAVKHAYHLYVVRVPDRDRVRAELGARGIDTGIHYPHPIHLMKGYEFLGCKPGSLPQTEALAPRLLSLPLYPELLEEDVRRVCRGLNDVLG
jgi:dTDP-3-amino-2,3,6-trideoxy-4-keto-D-glucose/dTDP-3-amino-3,4,6-trideoxy-alpha-D-glucose/dTDP-2,6-dideoxy-D-kanosamine transaminase